LTCSRYELCHDSFKSFLDPNNIVAQLLLAYFVGIQLLMVPLAAYEWPERADAGKARVLSGTVEWAKTIFERLETTNLKDQLGWPKRIAGIVMNELEGAGGDGPSVLRLDLPIQGVEEGSLSLSQEDSPREMEIEMMEGFWEEAVGKLPSV
jgi:hypothetical protein